MAPDTGLGWCAGWRFCSEGEAPIQLRLKQRLQDFVVEEQLSFTPSGTGEHLFLWIEKRGRSTLDVARQLARVHELEFKDVGWAGRKDTRAVTRQWFSVRGGSEVLDLKLEGTRVLDSTRNDRKLRLGALKGNRFALLLGGISMDDRPRAERVLDSLARRGLPNYFGPQRFGLQGRAADLGGLLLQGRAREYLLRWLGPEHTPASPALGQLHGVIAEGRRSSQRQLAELAPQLPREFADLARQLARRPGDWRSALRALDRQLLTFQLCAWQSLVFNRVLSQRFEHWLEPQRGDLLQLAGSGSLFEVTESEDVPSLRRRLAAFELHLTGPLPGSRAPYAGGEPGELERREVRSLGIEPERIDAGVRGLTLPGTRRSLRVVVEDLEWNWTEPGLELRFALPAGSYATTLVAELSKNPVLGAEFRGGRPAEAHDRP